MLDMKVVEEMNGYAAGLAAVGMRAVDANANLSENDEGGLVAQYSIRCQAWTQSEVKKAKGALPPVVWKREWANNWWTYEAVSASGIKFRMYACSEAPPQCKAVKKVRTVTKEVPVAFEKQEVVEEYIEWDCGKQEASDAEDKQTDDVE